MSQDRSLNRRNFKQLQIQPISMVPGHMGSSEQLPGATVRLASSEVGSRLKRYSQIPKMVTGLELKSLDKVDLEKVSDLGSGNGGIVTKVLHKHSGIFMARKMMYLESNEQVRRQIVTELETLKMCDSDFIVRYYGQFVEQNEVIVCMEFMDCGSLDKIYKTIGALSEDVLRYVNAAVVDGLVYLKQLNITHRDIKPSNILVNHVGDIKLCDFGVSGKLINSIAQTFVGTSMYMSPERIQGDEYTDAGDVWSLGLALVEMARGEFPIGDTSASKPVPIFELLQSIVVDPSPTLPDHFSEIFKSYVNNCLKKDILERITVRQLSQTPFYLSARKPQRENPLPTWAAALPRA